MVLGAIFTPFKAVGRGVVDGLTGFLKAFGNEDENNRNAQANFEKILQLNQENQKRALEDLQRQSDQRLEELKASLSKTHKGEMDELTKILQKANYECDYPMSFELKTHKKSNPQAFYIQILGCRGAGKSTFINSFLEEAGLPERAETGTSETTIKTAFYDITKKMKTIPKQYKSVFLVDQPGIGGLDIKEAEYLHKFSPGHYNLTLLLGEKGFNEMDLYLLNHLLHNKKPVVFVRPQCDGQIMGIRHKMKCDRDTALKTLQDDFKEYITKKVLKLVKLDNLEIFYVGLPTFDFPDFKKLLNRILKEDWLTNIANAEAKDISELN